MSVKSGGPILSFLNESPIYRMEAYTFFFKEPYGSRAVRALPLFSDQFEQINSNITFEKNKMEIIRLSG